MSEPASEYIRFEYDITFRNVAAGEDVRWLPRRRASGLLLPGNDFWVFDDRIVLWTHFTGEGEVSPDGWETTEAPAIAKTCATAFEAVWDRAVSHAEYQPGLSPRRCVRLHHAHLVYRTAGAAGHCRPAAGDPARRRA